MRLPSLLRALLSLGVAAAGITFLASPATAGGLQSWISGVGDDANPCTRTAPCKTWGGTIAKTFEGGTINVLDPGFFGALAIDKSVTIDGTGVPAYALAEGGANGITVNAPAGSHVVLRNITIKAAVLAGGVCDGGAGLRVVNGGSVRLDGVTIEGFQQAVDLPLTNSTGPVSVVLDGVTMSDNCQFGVRAVPDAGKTARFTIDGLSVSTSGVGLAAGTGAEGWVSNSQIHLNTVGIQPAGTGKIHALCGNIVAGNAGDGGFTDFTCGGAAVSPPAVTYCTVPKLKKKSKSQAAKLLADAGCALGKVKKQSAPKSKKGKVLSQDVVAGTLVKVGTKVGVVVGK